jgi:hypothetical protein
MISRPLRGTLRRLNFSAITILTILTLASTALAESPFGGATGGILRFPNTNQDKDSGNGFGEAWIKLNATLWSNGDTKLQAYGLANYVRDTKPFAYNNTKKAGLGVYLSTRLGEHLHLGFSARHDWFEELFTPTRREGWRYAIDYYYYRYVPAETQKTLWGMSKTANVFKSYGTLESPGSLQSGDDNVVLSIGGEYSTDYSIPDSELIFVPFVDMHFTWDADGNNYNNKIIPAIGAKLRYPVTKGEIFFGVKYEVDYRWQKDTLDKGPMIFLGWYKGF